MEHELTPLAFGNKINDLLHAKVLENFDWNNWRKSPEWKIFVAGYNAAVEKVNDKVKSQYNLGESTYRIFGGDKE
jgi:hypothetical protein